MEPKPDFSGWATKNDLVCADGRTIKHGAFKHMDKKKVPLVWSHQHSDPEMILGHAVLEDRAFGVYAHGYFNDTERGKAAKIQVQHGDLDSLSIWANNLRQKNGDVLHGDIREVSLVLAGANEGAKIEHVNLVHSAGFTEIAEDEAIIYNGLSLAHSDEGESNMATTTEKDETKEESVADIYESLNEKQKAMVNAMIADALDSGSDDEDEDDEDDSDSVEHSDIQEKNNEEFLAHIDEKIKEGFTEMSRNVFETNGAASSANRPTLSHDQLRTIVDDAKRLGSIKDSFLAHAAEYGIEDIDLLFPDAKNAANIPEVLKRQTEWVSHVLGGTKHTPFAKIKSLVFDITAEEARAKGYIKGTEKKEEVVKLLKRTTGPTTVYKKQKLDRDDLIDITDLDVVAWLKAEIRLMLNEEIARAILLGDGRSSASDDKVKDPEGAIDGTGIRSILHDHDMYAHKVELAANVATGAMIDEITRSRTSYRGSGNPTLYTTDSTLTDMLLEKDKMGRRLYGTAAELASVLRVKEIVPVEVMEEYPNVLGIVVNLQDYNIGANKGGELSFFSDFDIDFNQEKYLMETRISGALVKPKSAIVITREVGTAATPTSPSFNGTTNTITIPTVEGVIYTIDGEAVTGDVVITEDTTVSAVADEDYYIPANTTDEWVFTYSE